MAPLFSPVAVLPIAPLAYMLVFIVGAFLVFREGRNGEESGAKRDPASLVGIAIKAVAFFFTGFGPVRIAGSYANPAALLLFVAAAACGIGANLLFRASKRAMGQNWSIVARTREDHQLVRNGPFARVRHPIYLALLIYMTGLGLALGHVEQLVVTIPLYLVGAFYRIRIEERLLGEQFGAAFDEYRRSVPALIPRP